MADGVGVKETGWAMTFFTLFACFVAAWGGLIFGYDIGFSGASIAQFLKKFSPSIDNLFDSVVVSLYTVSLYCASMISSSFALKITGRFGRKCCMILGGLTFLIGAIINGADVNVAMLILGRLLLGVGIGFALQSVPLYLSEMAPNKYRGALNIGFYWMIGIAMIAGILATNIINYYSTDKIDGGWGWRMSLRGSGVPALFIVLGALILPDAPNSVMEKIIVMIFVIIYIVHTYHQLANPLPWRRGVEATRESIQSVLRNMEE